MVRHLFRRPLTISQNRSGHRGEVNDRRVARGFSYSSLCVRLPLIDAWFLGQNNQVGTLIGGVCHGGSIATGKTADDVSPDDAG